MSPAIAAVPGSASAIGVSAAAESVARSPTGVSFAAPLPTCRAMAAASPALEVSSRSS
ncbi:hypothetical protein [Streptosporangium sp. KLBMP 9127]|nr:hypothetical protein [Streptosporangium sp. KLBMP 9127]